MSMIQTYLKLASEFSTHEKERVLEGIIICSQDSNNLLCAWYLLSYN